MRQIPFEWCTCAEMAEIWSKKGRHCGVRFVNMLCQKQPERVFGMCKIGRQYLIPSNAPDPRLKRGEHLKKRGRK